MGTPQDLGERKVWIDTKQRGDAPNYKSLVSDGTLQVLNNQMNVAFECVFEDSFPTSLSTLPFDVTQTDTQFFVAEATFRYTLYEIRALNRGNRRTS